MRCPKVVSKGEVILVNTDSTDFIGAATQFSNEDPFEPFVLWVETYKEEDQKRHINIKETAVAVSAIPLVHRPEGGGIMILGLDNRTAVKAWRCGFYPGELMLSQRIWETILCVENSGWRLEPMYVPGIIQVADEPTRGFSMGSAAYKRKALECRKWMLEFDCRDAVDILLAEGAEEGKEEKVVSHQRKWSRVED